MDISIPEALAIRLFKEQHTLANTMGITHARNVKNVTNISSQGWLIEWTVKIRLQNNSESFGQTFVDY